MHRILSAFGGRAWPLLWLPVALVAATVLIVTGPGREDDSEVSYEERPSAAGTDGRPGAGVSEGSGTAAGSQLVSFAPTKLSERKIRFALAGISPDSVSDGRVRNKRAVLPVSLSRIKTAASSGKLTVKVPRKFGKLSRKKVTLEVTTEPTAVETAEIAGGAAAVAVQPSGAGAATGLGAMAAATPMLISAEQLGSLPTSGAAWDYMRQKADAAIADMDLDSTPSAMSPWLPNYNGSGTVSRPGVQTLAAALVYARTGDTTYRDFVILANRYLIGSEDSASTDGTSHSNKLLATSRNIGSYVVAADLVGMDRSVTGSRAGYTGTTWDSWLAGLRTKLIGGSSGPCESIIRCSNERAHNWGAFALGARISIDIYLGDQGDLDAAIARFQRYVGEGTPGAQFNITRDFDLTFTCVSASVDFTPINPASCGPEKDGMIVEDISRSAGSFPNYDSTGIGYTMESYQALLFSAILLERQGYDAFAWGDQALRRVMDWLTREGKPQGNGSNVERHVSWIPQHFYGRTYPTVPAIMGRTIGFTDWLFPS